MAKPKEIQTPQWDELVLKSDEPVLVDFWAPWCGPCRRIAPIVEELSQELAGRVKVAKCNTDEASEVATRYGVMSIPTLLVFADGAVKRRLVGAKGKAQLLEELSEFIA